MGCRSGSCDYVGLKQKLVVDKTADEIRYAVLWSEVELPKLLNAGGRK